MSFDEKLGVVQCNDFWILNNTCAHIASSGWRLRKCIKSTNVAATGWHIGCGAHLYNFTDVPLTHVMEKHCVDPSKCL